MVKGNRLRVRALAASIVAAMATFGPNAEAFQTGYHTPDFGSPTITYYGISPSIPIDAVYATEVVWEVDGQASTHQFAHQPGGPTNNRVLMEWIDGNPSGTDVLGDATMPCWGSSSNCRLRLDSGNNWYNGTGTPASNQTDMRSVLIHEFGHWHGLDHSDFAPGTDTRTPVMSATIGDGVLRRLLTQDDANGFQSARSLSPGNVLANRSFELRTPNTNYTSTNPFAGWRIGSSPNGQQSAWYCNDSAFPAHDGACFVEFNGRGTAGSSIYQDLSVERPGSNDGTWAPRLQFRVRGQAGSINLVVWWLDTTGPQFNQVTCQGAANVWTFCSLGNLTEPAGTRRIRIQVYNNTTGNVDVDSTRLY